MVRLRDIMLVLSILAFIFIARCEGVNEYDYLQVVFQWQPATCSDASKSYPYCYQTPNNKFSVHGMWPTLYYGLTHCSGSPFDINKVRFLVPRLNEMWENVITGDNYWLWEHEWYSHGSCMEDRLDQSGYFDYTMNTLYDFNPEEILYNGGIWPTGERDYTLYEIKSVIQARTGKLPAIRCNYNYWTSYEHVHEISYCTTKDGSTFIDCPVNGNNCNGQSVMWYRFPY